MVNALNIINKLEPVEYDQTYDLVEHYTQDTPKSHQCGFIAQSVEKIDELKHVVEGGEIGEDGKESMRGINYNAIFTYAVKAIQELSGIVKQQQIQIDAQKQQIYILINVILSTEV
ncbi:MAG: tail fiber domain-containing protein [Candidatus Fonsibacter sp.]